MQKAADEPPREVQPSRSAPRTNQATNCSRCGKPLGSTTHTAADGVVCHSCFGAGGEIDWVGVLEYQIDPERDVPIVGLRASRWRHGRLEEVRLDPSNRVTGVPRAGDDFECVGMCSHRVWDRDTGFEDQYDHLYEIYATPSGLWMAIDRQGELERSNGGEA